MVKDPAGLLERIPELSELCAHPRVRRALESGDAFKVYRALLWAKWTGALKAHRKTVDGLLSRRRLFARPLRGKLALSTVNSVGLSLVGAAEPDAADGTSIATHAVVVAFRVPLFPLGAYVVRPTSGNAVQRSWTIFARVPMGPLSWLYSRAVALALLIAAAVAGLHAFHASRNQDVRIVNAFKVPLQIALAGKTAVVPAGGMAVVNVPIGHQVGTATTEKGAPVDRVALEVRPGMDVFAWSIAGAAPLFQERVHYTTQASAEPENRSPDQVFCGQQVVAVHSVDDAFKAPPSSASIPEGQHDTYRSHLDLDVDRTKPDGALLCADYLFANHRYPESLRVAETRAALSGWGSEESTTALNVAFLVDLPTAIRVARRARDAHPEELELQRGYQFAMEQAGRAQELESEYRAAAAAAPESIAAQYLYARLLQGPAALQAVEKLAARAPQNDDILGGVTYLRYASGQWAKAAEGWTVLRQRNPRRAAQLVDEGTAAFFAAGNGREAIAAAQDLFERGPKEQREDVAVAYARLAQKLQLENPAALIERLEREGRQPGAQPAGGAPKLWNLRAKAGLSLDGAPAAQVKLAQLLRADPVAAVAEIRTTKNVEDARLDRPEWALLYAEALRTGDAKAQAVLERVPFLRQDRRPLFERYVRGEAVEAEALDVSPEVRAAAEVVRARNASLPAAEREKLLEDAQQVEPLNPLISTAARTWKL